MLLRKRETSSSIIAIALLAAILASAYSIVNHINSQAEVLEGFVNIGGTFLILSRSSTSISDSEVNGELVSIVSGIADVKWTLPQRALTATLIAHSGNHTIPIRGVEGVSTFLKLRRAYVNGTAAEGETEANVGEILARSVSVGLDDEVNLAMGNNVVRVEVVGVVRTLTQTDAGLIVPMETVHRLTGNMCKPSLIEFAIKDNVNEEEAINNIIELLPADVKVVKAQQLKEFTQEMNSQTLAFLNIWSLTVYAVVGAASYVVATRLIAESSYELAMLRALGAKRWVPSALVLTYTAATALLGSILGVALGVAGVQAASTIRRWMWPGTEITAFLDPMQALWTSLLTLASSTMGCIYPAVRNTRKTYVEPL